MKDTVPREKIEAEINWYNNALEEFVNCLEKLLGELGHKVTCTKSTKSMNEELSGRYDSYEYLFNVDGDLEFRVTPGGIWIVAAKGKIFIKGPRKSKEICYLCKGGPSITITDKCGGVETSSTTKVYSTVGDEGWYVLEKDKKIQPVKFEKEIVEDLLKEICGEIGV